MKNKIDLLDRFEHLESIEPTAEWNERVMFKINQPAANKEKNFGSRLVLFAIFLLLAINVFSVTKSWLQERSLQDGSNLRVIASEYLISTNSSKF
ncbi:MAG: hypothetical protein WCK18_15965 [Prolixibacteraceae bacterium]